MYNHPLYNGLMSGPATAGGVVAGGLVKRRQSEWILFKTGHYLFDYGDGGINFQQQKVENFYKLQKVYGQKFVSNSLLTVWPFQKKYHRKNLFNM